MKTKRRKAKRKSPFRYFWLNGSGEKNDDSEPYIYQLSREEAEGEDILEPRSYNIFLERLPRLSSGDGGGIGGCLVDILKDGDLLICGRIVRVRKKKPGRRHANR